MERADKIFTALMACGLIALLCWQCKGKPADRVNVSALPKVMDTGPAYLLSALPSHRRSDDFNPPVSYPEYAAF